jgi:hypothetical protein
VNTPAARDRKVNQIAFQWHLTLLMLALIAGAGKPNSIQASERARRRSPVPFVGPTLDV